MAKNNNPGIPKPKGDKTKGKVSSMSDHSRLTNVSFQCVWYMELAKAGKIYLAKRKRLSNVLKFRLDTEINMVVGIMETWLGLAPSWIQKMSDEIKADSDKWVDEVKRYADMLSPEKSLLVTENLVGEMGKLLGGRSQFTNKK